MQGITREHPDFRARERMWRSYRDLYRGGEEFRANAGEYLVARQREPGDVYQERLTRVFYENYVGSIVDWYMSTLFRREPLIRLEGGSAKARGFYGEFVEDCDLRGTSLTDFLREQMTTTLIEGASYVLLDFPRLGEAAANRAEEEASGRARAYLTGYRASELINWGRDARGNFEWVVLRTKHLTGGRPDGGEWQEETRWSYFDTRRYAVYRQEGKGDTKGPLEAVANGLHGMAKAGRVPLFELKVSDGLWLMNKAATLQLEHFNKSNALAWAITMGLFAMPVVYSARDWKQMVGESYYIQLGPEDRFGWTEPEGHVFQIAAENVGRLREEIYRVCYLMHQVKAGSDGPSESALSKRRDFAITEEVLRAYGDAVKDTAKKLLRAVGQAREDEIEADVSGLDDFDIGDFTAELSDAERLLKTGIASPTFEEQVQQKLALKFLCDVRQDIKDRIVAEIAAAKKQE